MSLNQQLTRYFDYMRPRVQNPTYKSSNVGSTLGVLSSPYLQRSQSLRSGLDSSLPTNNNQSPQRRQQEPKKDLLLNQPKHTKSRSNLSNYGTNSLSSLQKNFNERDIYEKQEKKYNIISIQPKQYPETIKKYPKFHLENFDQNYYKKLKLQNQYDQAYGSPQIQPLKNNLDNREGERKDGLIRQNEFSLKKIQGKPGFRPKMLNNIDELSGVL